jgi:ATP-dependent helicase/nuclease subunit A
VTGGHPPRELILASAGSGKTYQISSRAIALLAAGVEAEQVLASTFTRKAAGEILDRILARLARAALDGGEAARLASSTRLDGLPPPPADPAFWGRLLARIAGRLHRMNVLTLDAFFMKAATAFGTELGLPTGWGVPDVPSAARLRSRALLRLVESTDRAEMLELLRLVAGGTSRRSVHEFLAARMDRLLEIEEELDPEALDPWAAFQGPAPPQPVTTLERIEVADALASLPVPRTGSGGDRKRWVTEQRRTVDAVRTGAWEDVVGSTLCTRVAAGELSYDGAEIDQDFQRVIEEVLLLARRSLRPKLSAQTEALGRLAADYRAIYREIQAEEGLFGFADVTRLIGGGDPLGDRADLFYRLDSATRHVLLDEFQDTSRPQWEAIAPIVEEVLTAGDRAAVIVADPKQSIYGWRGAEPGIVHHVGERFSLVPIRLATSWRSSPVVLNFVNRVFTGIQHNPTLNLDEGCVRTAAAWARDFQEHRAQHEHLPGFVSVEVGPPDEGMGNQRPQLCRRAAERLAEIRGAAPGFSIGVLTRTNPTVARLFLQLRDLGVPVSQEGGNPLTDIGAAEAILALFRLADHPGDVVARYHVTRSPLGSVVGLSDWCDERAAATVARRLRRRLLNDGYGATCSSLIGRIIGSCDRREARRLGQMAELAHRYDAQASLRPMDFVRVVEAERVEDRTSAEVRVMTVHQAKGLEFDIVLLPELDAQIFRGGRMAPVAPYRAEPTGRITAVYPAAGENLRCLFPELEVPYQQGRAGVLRDAISGLYVALTRARYALHLLIAPDGAKGPGKATTPARIIREAIREPEEALRLATSGSTLFQAGDPRWYVRPGAQPEAEAACAPDSAAPPPAIRIVSEERTRMLPRQTPSQLHANPRVDVRDLLRLETSSAMARGSLIHAWFERISWVEDTPPADDELLRVGREIAPDAEPSAMAEMLSDFHTFLRYTSVRRALSRARYPTLPRLERELPFVHRRGGMLMEGVIDRLVLVPDVSGYAAAEVIDFKTDRVTRESLRIEELARRHRAQLIAYLDVVSEMFRIPADRCHGTLLFLEADLAVPVSREAPPAAPLQLEL